MAKGHRAKWLSIKEPKLQKITKVTTKIEKLKAKIDFFGQKQPILTPKLTQSLQSLENIWQKWVA